MGKGHLLGGGGDNPQCYGSPMNKMTQKKTKNALMKTSQTRGVGC